MTINTLKCGRSPLPSPTVARSSTHQSVFLKPNVLIEPLFNGWYAWPYLIAPATAALCTENLHLKILQSFVAAPQVHIDFLKEPKNMGGPFLDYPIERVGEVATLLEQTKREAAPLLQLAVAIKQLDKHLMKEAKGYSLEPLYGDIPTPLKGYVELLYDLNNFPSLRFIEGLLYKSPYYMKQAQSIQLSLTTNDDRSFIFSTPRLLEPDSLRLPIAFDHPGIDMLFQMRYNPKPLGWIQEQLQITPEQQPLFQQLFSDQPNTLKAERYNGDDVRIRYYGHACLLIETSEVSLLTDPVICYDYDNGIDCFSYADLPAVIDYVLITHSHQDHVLFEHLLPLRHRIGTIVVPKSNGGALADPSLKLMFRTLGFKNVIELDEMESLPLPDGVLTGLPFPGEHVDINIRSKIAYHIALKHRTVMCLADSTNVDPALYDHIHAETGNVDVMFLGMECDGGPATWLYGPLMTKPLPRSMDQSRRFESSDYRRAIQIVARFQPEQVYVYAMGQEPWLRHLTSIIEDPDSKRVTESNRLLQDCHDRGMAAERLYCKKELHLTDLR